MSFNSPFSTHDPEGTGTDKGTTSAEEQWIYPWYALSSTPPMFNNLLGTGTNKGTISQGELKRDSCDSGYSSLIPTPEFPATVTSHPGSVLCNIVHGIKTSEVGHIRIVKSCIQC